MSLVLSTTASPHWASLIAYLSIYLGGLLAVTIAGWALYHAKPTPPKPKAHSPRYRINGITITSAETLDHTESSQPSHSQPQPSNDLKSNPSIAWSKYFLLLHEKAWIILSLFLHITIQAFNFAIMIEFISLAKYEQYSFDPSRISKANLTEIALISFASFILYRFGSAILIWKLSHSIRKSTFQIIDVTVLYQLLKGYKKHTRNNPGRIVQYISYLNAIFQSWAQAIVQLLFLMKTRIIGDIPSSASYSFIYIVLIAFILNIYCVVKAIYKKDFLLTSESYRETKTCQQIFVHVIFRVVDVSLRIIILAMLWLTLGFTGVMLIVCLEFFTIAYLARATQQMQRFQEMVAVVLHTAHFTNAVLENEREVTPDANSRPVTPVTIRMTNELQVQLNVDIETMAQQEEERKREHMRACECFKWRIVTNMVYIGLFTLLSQLNEFCLICPEYKHRNDVSIGQKWSLFLTIYCLLCVALYPFMYWLLKSSNRWHYIHDEGDVFGYLQRNDFESATEILEFGKTISAEEWIKWASQRDFSADNDPNGLIQFLYQQNVILNSIINKSQGGLNILHQICKNPELDNASATLQLLIRLGFDMAVKTEKAQDTPLHIACSHCNKSVMLALLNDTDNALFVQNKLNQTPLHSLMIGYDPKYEDNQISMTSLLFSKYDAERIVSDVDVHGQSPLHIACLNRSCPAEIVRLLLFNGAYASQRDNDDFYPKDHVEQWDYEERDDIDLVLKWLNKGQQKVNCNERTPLATDTSQKHNILSYVELSDERETKRIVYHEESDDEDENCIDPHDMVTPIDPSPRGMLDVESMVSLSHRMNKTHKVPSRDSEEGDGQNDDDGGEGHTGDYIIVFVVFFCVHRLLQFSKGFTFQFVEKKK
eukprot:524902_1